MAIRPPAVAGFFYPGKETQLRDQLAKLIPKVPVAKKKKVLGMMVPHAGYPYSGALAGKAYAALRIPKSVVILGVNHQALGQPYAIEDRKGWETPLGAVPIDRPLADAIGKNCPDLKPSHAAFDSEHSLEVHVPFLQSLADRPSIVPIAIAGMDAAAFERLGKGIAAVLKDWKEEVLLVASTDMTHYEDADTAKAKDKHALDAVLAMDPQALLRAVATHEISMCGYAPTTILLHAMKGLGATKAEMIGYCNSGDASGDYSSVVAYAACTFSQ